MMTNSTDWRGSVFIYCLILEPSSTIYVVYLMVSIVLLLPLCVFILHHGFQQWRKNRSSSSSSAATCHSYCFTYHMVLMELITVGGNFLSCGAVYTRQWNLVKIARCGYIFALYGEVLIHLLSCVERYLAVVHPVTYMSLRNERGTRIRNGAVTCVWLLCFLGLGLEMSDSDDMYFVDLSFMMACVAVVSFCSLSVLLVLMRPGPGGRGGNKARLDRSKRRAFYNIVTILGVLQLRFTSALVWVIKIVSGGRGLCVMVMLSMLLSVPSSLVLPLLFLNKEGKALCFKKKNNKGGKGDARTKKP